MTFAGMSNLAAPINRPNRTDLATQDCWHLFPFHLMRGILFLWIL
jgi:hypothetical protein